MSANTPITWRYERETEFNCSAIIASNGNIICEFADEPEEQYAELIAASPETAAERDRLREINAELLHAIETLLGETDDSDYMSQAEREAVARAAVAKSKGGAA